MKQVRYLLYLFFLLLAGLSLPAQVKPLLQIKKVPVNTINYEQGLLNNETENIITDTLGFTWVGTLSGLQRYNGYTFENIYPVVGRDTFRIRSQVYLFRLKNGNLWISWERGILEYNPFTNIFKNVIRANAPANLFFAIIPLSETPEGVWCLKKGAGIVIYDKTGVLKRTVPSINIRMLDSVIGNDFVRIDRTLAHNKDHIFVCTDTHHLLVINTLNNSLSTITYPGNEIIGIGCNAGFFYISTNNSIDQFQLPGTKPLNRYLLRNLTLHPITRCLVHPIGNNRVMVSVNEQMIEFDASLHHPKLLATFNGGPLLTAGVINHVYDDAYQRVWLLTNDDIKRIQNEEIPFNYLKYPEAGNNFVRSLYFDEKEQLLLAGCFNGGLQVYNSASDPLWSTPLQTDDVKDVLAITKLSPGNYLIITWTKGWFLLDLKKRELSALNFTVDAQWKKLLYANSFSNNIQRLNDSTLLVTSRLNVFGCIFRGNALRSVKPVLPSSGTAEDWINTSYLASDSTLWVGQYRGLVYRMERNGKVSTISLPEKFSTRCFAEDADHHIWIGTSGGLYVCTSQGRLLKSFYKSSGLLNDCIYSLLPVKGKSSVFASSNMGLSDISFNGNIKNYTKELGLQDNEFNTAAALVTSAGKYYFGGVNGITSFYPLALNALQTKPILNMTKLVVNDSSYNSSGIWRGDTIRVKYNQNHLQFDFAAMGPLNADKYFYKYRLIGFEKTWQSTHQPIGIRYILQPGNYTLEVTCGNELSGPEVKKSVLVIIDPPFWLKWWFFVGIGACATATVVLIVTYYNRRRYQKALQELMVNQRLQSQRERISRDLHDNLGAQANAIFYGTELLKKSGGNERVLVDNLHDTAGDMVTVLRETLWAMRITRVEAANLWLRVLNFARKIGTYYPEVKIDISGNPPGDLTINASMALNMILIVQEAINNAIRHSDASVISIISYAHAHSWRIEIIDNGKGFDLSAVSEKTESYGLDNMAERAQESNIRFAINSVPVHGTKIFLEIDLLKMESQLT